MRARRVVSVIASLVALVLLTTACKAKTTSTSGTTPATKTGGTLIFGAEQYPKCLNPVTSCYNASWLHYTATLPVLPQLLTLDSSNNYVASPLIKRVPSIDNGLVKQNPFSVTYELNPNAVWDDGSPITGADVTFTVAAYKTAPKSIFKTSGFDKISDVQVTGTTVTLMFSAPYADWKDLMGGGGEYVLKAAAFGGNPDISTAMQNDLGFSGGPFKLTSFTASEMTLVRNDKFWGDKPSLDKVVFRKIADATAEINAFKTGEIQAFYPQPSVELVQQVKSVPGGQIGVKAGTVYEGLWMNLDKFPVNDKAVRTALLYGLDRQQAINTVVHPVDPNATVNHCLWNVPSVAGGKWCNNDFPTTQDTAMATKALTDGGWVKGADGIYTKGGKRLTIPLATTAGNAGREQMQQIFIQQAKAIGIEITADNSDSTTLFQTRLPARNFTMAMFAQVATPDPDVEPELHSREIPSATNANGQNYYGWRNPQADALLDKEVTQVDETQRVDTFKQLGQLTFQDVMSVPLYPKPQILVYNSDKLSGNFDFNAGQMGFGHIIATWSLK